MQHLLFHILVDVPDHIAPTRAARLLNLVVANGKLATIRTLAKCESTEPGLLAQCHFRRAILAQESAAPEPSQSFKHVYPIRCPGCSADLTRKGVVEISFNLGHQMIHHVSRLEADGSLVDVDDLIRHGYHSGTLCRQCGCNLDRFEINP